MLYEGAKTLQSEWTDETYHHGKAGGALCFVAIVAFLSR
jgi:hypothetical protein